MEAHERWAYDDQIGVGRYHKRYRTLATELGLDVAETGAIGWSATTLAAGTAELYTVELAAIEAALVAFRHPEGPARTDSEKQERHHRPLSVRPPVPDHRVRAGGWVDDW